MTKNKKKLLVAGIVTVLLLSMNACGSDDDYRSTLESGQKKYYSGESMTREEYNAVKSFNDWKSNQGEKTYDEWD